MMSLSLHIDLQTLHHIEMVRFYRQGLRRSFFRSAEWTCVAASHAIELMSWEAL